uniref:RdRp n=1 Tax=viral metagenome TaxID=1070528 RepID=A0A2V0RLN6_9ZZZZ
MKSNKCSLKKARDARMLKSFVKGISSDYSVNITSINDYNRDKGLIFGKGALVRLDSHFNKLFYGDNSDLTSPFFKLIPYASGFRGFSGYDNDNIRKLIFKTVKSVLSNSSLYNSSDAYRAFEDDQVKRLGNTSLIVPFCDITDGLIVNVLGFFSRDSNISYDSYALEEAVSCVRRILPEEGLLPCSLEEAYDRSDKTSNWGPPYWLPGRNTIDDDSFLTYGEFTYNVCKNILVNNLKIPNLPCVAVIRVQPNGTDTPKQRLAWAVSHIVTLLESRYQIPLVRQLKDVYHFSESKSEEATDSVMNEIFDHAIKHDLHLIGFDAKLFDISVPQVLIKEAYGIIADWFDNDSRDRLVELSEIMYSSDLITPIGVFTGREAGISSGMAFTNTCDSIVQLILFHYVRLKLNAPEAMCRIICNGDDGVWIIPGLTPGILSTLVGDFGMVVNPDKVSYSKYDVSFCQRFYEYNYKIGGLHRGVRSLYRVLSSMTVYERIRRADMWNDYCDSVRCIMQLENLKWSPSFEETVSLLMKADRKYSLGMNLFGGINELYSRAGDTGNLVFRLGTSSWERNKIRYKLDKGNGLSVVKLIEDLFNTTL